MLVQDTLKSLSDTTIRGISLHSSIGFSILSLFLFLATPPLLFYFVFLFVFLTPFFAKIPATDLLL